jgi:CRP/FNR family transcriptional regulator, anaerobic regulatory protein
MSADPADTQSTLAVGRAELNAKFHGGSPRILRAGELLTTSARPDDVLYRLRAGWAYRFRDLSNGSRAIVDIHLPGDLIGLDTVLCSKPVTNVRCLTTAAVDIIVTEQGLKGVIASRAVALYLSWLAAERLERADQQLASISCLDARGRIAIMVLDFYQRLESQKLITEFSFNLPLTQNHIGSYLGVTVVHINRVIRALRHAGIVNIEKHFVTIYDLQALKDLVITKSPIAKSSVGSL